MAEVHFTRRALADVEAIDTYSVEKFGERVASKYLNDLFAGAKRLGESSGLLQRRPDSSLRLLFYRVREHVLVCDRLDGRIFVLAVIHTAMDLPRRVLELEPTLVAECEMLARRLDSGGSEDG